MSFDNWQSPGDGNKGPGERLEAPGQRHEVQGVSAFNSKLLHSLLLLILAFAFSGCAAKQGSFPYHTKIAPLPEGSICRVAVLPFVNEADFPLADSIAYKVFLTEFAGAGNYHLAQEGDVLKVYQHLRLLPGTSLNPEQLKLLGGRLGAQLLITGNVIETRENPGEHGSVNPVLALNIQIRDAGSGDVLWSTYHQRQGTDYRKAMHFGTIHTVTGLNQQVAREIINLWLRQGLKQCDVSSRF